MRIETDSKLLRDLLLGFVKVHILYHAHLQPIYGTGISFELERRGYQLSWGTLYPVLHALEADGLLDRKDRIVEGKIRKYYSITPTGQAALKEATQKALELVAEVTDVNFEAAVARPRRRRSSKTVRTGGSTPRTTATGPRPHNPTETTPSG